MAHALQIDCCCDIISPLQVASERIAEAPAAILLLTLEYEGDITAQASAAGSLQQLFHGVDECQDGALHGSQAEVTLLLCEWSTGPVPRDKLPPSDAHPSG